MAGAVYELQRLREELDVDETAATQLDVVAAARLLAQLHLHASANLPDLLQRCLRQRRAVDHVAQDRAHPAPERAVAQHEAGAREALSLPQIAVLHIVPSQRVHGSGEATALAAGAQAKVHREGDTGRRDVAEVAREA